VQFTAFHAVQAVRRNFARIFAANSANFYQMAIFSIVFHPKREGD
jgi:hypothetical protein